MQNKKSTINVNSVNNKRQYGFFTMFAMIVGAVIGAGIFFKNTSIMNSTNSATLTMIVWVIVSLIVVFMIIALLETTSSTARSKETGTVGIWMNKFYGRRTGKIISWFYVLVYLPSGLAIMMQYSVDQLGEGIIGWTSQGGSYIFQSTANASWVYLLCVFGISVLLIVLLGYWDNKSKKWPERFQRWTLIIKLIPIALIIAMFFVLAVSPALTNQVNQTPQYANNSPLFNLWAPTKNAWSNGGSKMSIGFILALPAVMFAFDGFIYTGALQNEAKNKDTFRKSLFFGIIFIAVIYILFSWAILSLSNGNGYSIFDVLFALFPNQPWVALTIDLIVVISILGAFNSSFITSIRNISSMSEEDYVIDRKGFLLKRNAQGIPENAGTILMISALIWLLVVTGFNVLWTASDLYWQVAAWFNANTMNVSNINQAWSSVGNTWAYVDTGNVIWTMHATDGIGEMASVFAFIIYAFVAFGGVFNRSDRFTKVDVAVDPVKGYSFFAWIALISILAISIINIGAIGYEGVNSSIWIIDWFFFFTCIFLPLIIWYIFEKKLNNTDPKVFEGKKEYKEAYKMLLTYDEYQNQIVNNNFDINNNLNNKVVVRVDSKTRKRIINY